MQATRKRKVRKRSRKAPYVMVGIVVFTLFSLDFFYHSRHFKWESTQNHFFGELGLNVQNFLVEVVTGMDISRLGSLIGDGLGFGGLVGERFEPTASSPPAFHFFRIRIEAEEPASLEVERVSAPVDLGDEPIVFLFNSHTEERFYDGVSDVIDITKAMAEVFEANGVPVFREYRVTHHWLNENWGPFQHALSYDATRIFLEERKYQMPSLQFFFDIHRDARISDPWRTIDGVDLARLQFIIGARRNPNYRQNLEVANSMANFLEEWQPGIMRYNPIAVHTRLDSEARFNQDMHPNIQLLEFGDEFTPFHAAKNSARIFAEAMSQYILLQLAAQQE